MYTFSSNGSFHNYGEVINSIFPESSKWVRASLFTELYDLSNSNSKSKTKAYLDGVEFITTKALLPVTTHKSEFTIPTIVLDGKGISATGFGVNFKKLSVKDVKELLRLNANWFLKPSHPFVGSAKGIEILTSEKVVERIKHISDNIDYVLQPSLGFTTHAGRKWDCRHYSVIVYNKFGKIAHYTFPKAFSRITTKVVGPEPESLITNISIQEKDTSYDVKRNQMFVNERVVGEFLGNIASECFERVLKHLKPIENESGYVILGFDTIFSSKINIEVSPSSPELHNLIRESKIIPSLIEVNNQPYMRIEETPEGFISKEVWIGLRDSLLPWTLSTENIDPPVSPYTGEAPSVKQVSAKKPGKWAKPKEAAFDKGYGKARFAVKK